METTPLPMPSKSEGKLMQSRWEPLPPQGGVYCEESGGCCCSELAASTLYNSTVATIAPTQA